MRLEICASIACFAASINAADAASVITLSPANAHPGAVVTFNGSGFGASEPVDVYLDTVDSLLLVTSSDGAFSGSVTLPASALPGKHYITGIGRKSGDAAQSAVNVTTAWANFGFGAARLGWNPYENILSTSNVASLSVLWAASSGTYGTTPAVVTGRVYVSSAAGIQARTAGTGALQWNSLTSSNFYGSPAVAGSSVYIGDVNGNFYSLNAITGATNWSKPIVGGAYGSPNVVGNAVYVGDNNGVVHAFNAATGATLWTYAGAGTVEATPAVANGVVYVGTTDDIFHALNATTGAQLWSYTTGDAVESSAAVVNGVVYFGSDDEKVYAITTSGSLLWSVSTGGPVYGSPSYANGVVFVGSQDGNLYALDARTGSTLWTDPLGGIASSAIVANGVVYTGARTGTVYALNAANGNVLASAHLGYPFLGSAAVSDGVVYLNSFDGGTYAFGLLAGVDAVPKRPALASLHPDPSLAITH